MPQVSRILPKTLVLALGVSTAPFALATNGYLPHGYGVAAKGAAGAGIALAQDTLSAASNPALLLSLGNRIDFGLDVFSPRRGSSITGNAFGPDQRVNGNDDDDFLIPEFGYTQQLNPDLAFGLTVNANGGMNTGYERNPYARFGATGPAGIDLAQMFLTPALAFRFAEGQSLGVGLNLAYQHFKAYGIDTFGQFSSDPLHVSNKGYDSSSGVGARIGWHGEFTEQLSAGASWQSKTRMSEFHSYKGLFANAGDFDVPEHYTLGLAFKPIPALALLADYQRINYSDIPAVGNSVSSLFAGKPLGSHNGPGFGWKDVNVKKFGAVYTVSPTLTLRAGYSDMNQPIPASETFFNILAPGVMEKHYTLGASFALTNHASFSTYVAHAPKVSIQGNNSIPPGMPNQGGMGGGNANLHMYQNAIGFAFQQTL
ncbi:putative membrane protein involved in aromatic hydrocarbon degradation [gamma proteobacterium HdN1]|nr:putative membrane protein involved in aromatic hydrocarbon degradation [gamma proteobacterium HdN1]